MIHVSHLTKTFGRVTAVDDISFDVKADSVVGFLGPNGAGKSTTLKVMTCYLPATSGTITIDGLDVLANSLAVRQRIGYMPESVPLYPDMRVSEYLHFRASLRDIPRKARAAAVDRVTERCWLSQPTDMVRRRLGELSRGYKQRVGLAESLLHDPPVLVLDEPTVGLDPAQIRSMRQLIQELGQDHTVILSSHILAEVERTCDQLVVIAGGKLVASGTSSELRKQVYGASQIVMELRGADPAVMQKAVEALPNVQRVKCESAGKWTRLTVTPTDESDLRPALAAPANNRGWPLRELTRCGASLEDFFVQITYKQMTTS